MNCSKCGATIGFLSVGEVLERDGEGHPLVWVLLDGYHDRTAYVRPTGETCVGCEVEAPAREAERAKAQRRAPTCCPVGCDWPACPCSETDEDGRVLCVLGKGVA